MYCTVCKNLPIYQLCGSMQFDVRQSDTFLRPKIVAKYCGEPPLWLTGANNFLYSACHRSLKTLSHCSTPGHNFEKLLQVKLSHYVWINRRIQILDPILKGAVSRDFWHSFISWIKPIRAPDKQAKMVLLKIRFRGDIREKLDTAQANTAQSRGVRIFFFRTPRRLTLRRVNN